MATLDPAAANTMSPESAGTTHSNAQVVPYSRSYTETASNNPKPAKPKVSKSWSLDDPEAKRKRRVASYKVYTVEGRVKSSFRKSIRWLKTKYVDMRYGWW